MTRMLGRELDRTKYATKFYNDEHELVLWRSGRHLGSLAIPADERPVLGERVVYEQVRTVETGDRRMDADEVVFTAASSGER